MLKAVALGRDPSFEVVMSILNQINGVIKKEELVRYFKKYVFDFTQNKIPLFTSCFSQKNVHSFDFLRKPVKAQGRYFTNSNEQESLVAFFSLNYQEVYAFIERVEVFLHDKGKNIPKLLAEYGVTFANQAVDNLESTFKDEFETKDIEKIKNFFNYYSTLIQQGKSSTAISLLLLYTVINVNIVYIIDYVQEKVEFFSDPAIRVRCNTEYVICSALNDDTFLTIEETDEPLNEDDISKDRRKMLFAQKKNFLTYKNSVFTIEAATQQENLEDDTDNDFGHREFPMSERGISMERVMNILISIGTSMFGNMPFKHSKKYYIKSSNGLYLSFIDWHTESRLVFLPNKTKKSRWFIDFKKDGSIILTPSGGLQYACFAIDIPNATQKTNMIPMWLFVKNNTKAQRFKLLRVSR